MVLESLINPMKAEKQPWEVFFIGFLYATVAVFLSLWIFREHSSLVMVFLTVLTCVPLIYSTIKLEEEKDVTLRETQSLLKEHSKAITFLLLLFVGFVLAYALWYVVLPDHLSTTLFSAQTNTINNINSLATGKAIAYDAFMQILTNNLRVLTFSVLFAFIYGAGAIFILTWNASVVGAAMGFLIKSRISEGAVVAVSAGVLRYFIHGIPEMAAYFIGGLAGSVLSISLIRGHHKTKRFERVLFDVVELIAISIVLLLLAAFLEIYVTPFFT